MNTVIALVVVFALSFASAQIDCSPNVNGVNYDLSPLMAQNGSYVVSGSWNNTMYTFMIQVCGDVSPKPSSCGKAAPIYQLSTDQDECNALGDSNVYAWDETPFQDGLMLNMYHGDWANHITAYQSILYITCNPKVVMSEVVFEHMRYCTDPDNGLVVGLQAHFNIQTKLVC